MLNQLLFPTKRNYTLFSNTHRKIMKIVYAKVGKAILHRGRGMGPQSIFQPPGKKKRTMSYVALLSTTDSYILIKTDPCYASLLTTLW
jgi:hypothetical protein